MKKFSNISNYAVGEKPAEVEYKIDEADLFRLKVINLLEQFLSIETYGPVDRYLRAGSLTIKGKEMAADAILSLLDEKTVKEQAKLLESLKSDVRDWEVIDNKIEDLNEKLLGDKFKTVHKVKSLLEKYDEEILIGVLENKIQSVNKVETLQSYLEAFNTVGTLQEETLQKINKIYTDKIEQIKNPS
jgi:hypothetical protein